MLISWSVLPCLQGLQELSARLPTSLLQYAFLCVCFCLVFSSLKAS